MCFAVEQIIFSTQFHVKFLSFFQNSATINGFVDAKLWPGWIYQLGLQNFCNIEKKYVPGIILSTWYVFSLSMIFDLHNVSARIITIYIKLFSCRSQMYFVIICPGMNLLQQHITALDNIKAAFHLSQPVNKRI